MASCIGSSSNSTSTASRSEGLRRVIGARFGLLRAYSCVGMRSRLLVSGQHVVGDIALPRLVVHCLCTIWCFRPRIDQFIAATIVHARAADLLGYVVQRRAEDALNLFEFFISSGFQITDIGIAQRLDLRVGTASLGRYYLLLPRLEFRYELLHQGLRSRRFVIELG